MVLAAPLVTLLHRGCLFAAGEDPPADHRQRMPPSAGDARRRRLAAIIVAWQNVQVPPAKWPAHHAYGTIACSRREQRAPRI